MARTFTMAPQAPHPMAAKQSPVKPTPGKSPGAAPVRGVQPGHPVHSAHHTHPAHPLHPAHRGGLGGWVTLVVIACTALAGGLWFWLSGPAAVDPGTLLLEQMEGAAKGAVPATHAFGGALTVERANGRINVVAEGVPSRACVQVGWRLAREGTIIVNGTLPTRLSAAKLSDLCSGDGATLMWVPDE